MSTIWIVLIPLGFLVLVGFSLLVLRPLSASVRPDKVAESVGLPLTTAVEPVIRSIQQRQVRTMFVSVAVGLAIATTGLILARVTNLVPVFWLDFTATMASAGAASVVATIAREDGRQKSQVRFARLRAISISDYRSPFDRWFARAVVFLAVVALVIRGAFAPGGFAAIPALAFAYIGVTVLSLVISEIGSRIIIRGGQPAGSPIELAWDDAFKSRALATLTIAPLYLGAYYGLVSITLDPRNEGLTELIVLSQLAVGMTAFVLLLVSIVVAVVTKPQQRYLRRLWPELVPTSGTTPVQPTAAPQS